MRAAGANTLSPSEVSEDSRPELMALAPGTMVGEYRIEGRLGEGGMATVYSAIHPLIGKRGAIKVMSPELSADAAAVERFVQEARAVNQIGHQNIVDVFAFGTLPDGRSYFVMEWLLGETLHARIEREPLKLRDTIAILFDVCDALEAAHEKGIVHRDLKPENIFLVSLRNNRRQVKLLDFGVAKLNATSDARIQRTRQDMIIGTPHYLSPEQARAKPVDHRTDVYSLGVMAFEMVVGQVPFDADNVMDILLQHMTYAPPVPSSMRPGIPAQLDELLVRMLDKAPENRPSIDEVRGVLAQVRDTIAGEQDGFLGPMEDSAQHGIAAVRRPTPNSAPIPIGEVGRASSDGTGAEPEAVELDSSSLRPKRAWLLPAGIGAAALVGGLVYFATRPATAPTPPAVAPAAAIAPAPMPPPPVPAVAKTTLRITVDAPDATIEVDEVVVAEHASSANVTLDAAGSHVVKASAAGRRSTQKVVNVAAGKSGDLSLSLPKMAAPRPKAKKQNADYMIDPFGKQR